MTEPAQQQPKVDAQGAWLEDIHRIISPNSDPRPSGTDIDMLVIHSISLPPGKFGGGYIERLFTNTLPVEHHPCFVELAQLRVSAHILIDRAGVLTQYVPFNQRAWHAGISEFAGRKNCNDYSIGVELEGCDDKEFTPVQYTVLVQLISAIMRHWSQITKQRIVGHCHIATDRKTDPGPRFDWNNFYTSL